MVGEALIMNHNSYLKNETGAMLLVGGKITRERGGLGAFSFQEIADRVTATSFGYLCSTGSKILNKGVMSQPPELQIYYSADAKANIQQDGGSIKTR